MFALIYLLTDIYGNEIGIYNKELAEEILNSGTNPFNNLDVLNEYDGLIVNTLEEFCDAFY